MAVIASAYDTGTGTCCGHASPPCIPMTGFISTFSPTTLTNSFGIARIGDVVFGNCGHTGVIVSGSSTTYVDGKPVALGNGVSVFSGTFSGVIIGGMPGVTAT